MNLRSCAVHRHSARLLVLGFPAMEARMKRQILMSGLISGAALALLGGCASYDDDYYGRGAYGSGGGGVYYEQGYYGPDYLPYGYYGGHAYAPNGAYGG